MSESGTLESPTISIVIPVFNGMPYLKAALDTVVDYPSDQVEIVVQDGASTDGTLDLLSSYGDRLRVRSESDSGQTQALNRGIARSRGQFIGWLNSDDLYAPGALLEVIRAIRANPEIDAFYGDWTTIRQDGSQIRERRLKEFDWRDHMTTNPNPAWSGATFWRREVFERYGKMDESLHFCMDFDFFMRVSPSIKSRHIPHIIGSFRYQDSSKTTSVPLGFIVEGHRIQWKHSGGTLRGKLITLSLDARRAGYIFTRRIWLSRAWTRVRPVKRMG